MTRLKTILLLAAGLPLITGCDPQGSTGPGVEFIAANSSTVIVDMTRSVDGDLDLARVVANQKCGLFGGSSAKLDSLNAIARNRERATFLCR